MGLSKADPHVRVLRLPSLTLASRSMATAQVAPSQPMKKAGYEPEQTFHRIRITLTSRNVANLERVCAELIKGAKEYKLKVKGRSACRPRLCASRRASRLAARVPTRGTALR